MGNLLFLTIFLLIGSAFCSSSEAAVFSASKIKVQTMADKGHQGAKSLLYIKENISRSIGALVIMNNLFNIVGSILVGVVSAHLFNEFWLGVFSTVFTFLIIIIGEVLPKNFGEKNAIAYGIFIAKPVILFSKIFSPILYIMELLSSSLFGSGKRQFVSEEEIRFMADLGMKEQSIEKDEQYLIQNVFKMNDKTAKDILTPRVNIEALDADLNLESQKDEIYKSSHSRLMVFGEDYDDIKGFVLLREVLQALAEDVENKSPLDYIHPVITIKENTRVDSLLIMFQKKRSHIALVVDEFGGTSGIVTLEDVLEELVGEIVDETDEVVDMRDIQP